MRRTSENEERQRERRSPAWLGEVVARSPETIVVFDADYVIVYANDAGAALLRTPLHQLIGSSALPFVHPEDLVRASSNIEAVTNGIQPRAGVMSILLPDGTSRACDILPMHLDLAPEPDGPGDLRAVILRDTALPDAHWKFLTSLSGGESFERSVALLADGLSGSIDGPLAVAYDDETGRRLVGPVPRELAGVTADATIDASPGTPWHDAIATGEAVVRDVADLPHDLRRHATAIGAAVGIVVPVPDPGHPAPALIVQWASDDRMGVVLREAILRRPYDAVKLALERRHAQDRLVHHAHHDDLTGLANRRHFFDVLGDLRDDGSPFAVCYLDLDHFKPVNDTFGHQRGDEALAGCAAALLGAARERDLVARLGGDEFAVACPGVEDLEDLAAIAGRLVAAVAQPLDLDGDRIVLGATVGCALGRPGSDPDHVVRAADVALYEAKRTGRGTVRVSQTR